MATCPQSVIVYDNMNFKDTTRHEVLGHKAEMKAFTTAAIIISPCLPEGGLTQDMHDATVPLSLQSMLESPGLCGNDNGVGANITRSLIVSAVRRVHQHSISAILSARPGLLEMPAIDRIETTKTHFQQFGGIFEDEGTIQGTYRVHDNIFIDQLQMRAPIDPASQEPDDFRQRLWLVHGDQLTAQRIRSVKAERASSTRPYDRRDWLLGVPAWFHIQMNLLNTIVRTHWAPVDRSEEAHHCLEADSITWNHTGYSRENVRYHLMEPLVCQSFSSRVLMLFYAEMQKAGYFSRSPSTIDEYSDIISTLSADQLYQLVNNVRLNAFTLQAWEGRHADTEFRTMCRMLQEIELFLTVRHAVKTGDIGILRWLVDPLAVLFIGAGQHNYGREMLFYRWHLSEANTPDLQRSILASGLVNWQGKPDTFKPTDLMLEHLNCSCKIEMKCYKNSTHDVNTVFDRVCLASSWIRSLRVQFEGYFGVHMPGDHTSKDAVLDIFLLATNLIAANLSQQRPQSELSGKYFDSADIKASGMDLLAEKVDIFNSEHILRHGYELAVEDVVDTDDGFADIDAYCDAIEGGEGVVDTVDLTLVTSL